MAVRNPEFDNILNFRDVASTINDHTGKTLLRPGKLYRSARPDSATQSDKDKLLHTVKIKTIIDLRSKTEHLEAAQKYQAAKSTAAPTSNAKVAQSLKIKGANYAEINLNGKGFERHLVWQLGYGDLAMLAGYMTFGYRLQGISIIGRKVLGPRGLIGLGKDTIKHSGPEIREVFDVLGRSDNWPVLVHCTQGKDRTGLVVLLVLLLCGADVESIKEDYVMSEEELKPEFEERMKEIRSIGLDESFAGCPPAFVPEITGFIEKEYGGVEGYLASIGVKEDQVQVIRRQLLL